MEGGPLLSEEFVNWSKDYVLYNHVTTKIKGEKYGNNLGLKGGSGFPYLAFLDAEGTVLAVHNGARNPEGFAKTAEEAKAMLDLRAKAEAGDKAVAFDLLAKYLSLAPLEPPTLDKMLALAGELTPEQKTRLEPLTIECAFKNVLADVNEDKATQVAAGEKFAAMAKAGKIPADPRMAATFHSLTLAWADETKSVAEYETSFKALSELMKSNTNPKAQKWLAEKQARLDELKAGSAPQPPDSEKK